MAHTVGPGSHLSKEMELSRKHEEIVERRTALLEHMEREQERLKSRKKLLEASCSRQRNVQLLADVQKLQNRLQVGSFLHPEVVSLQTRYWAFVEEKIPEWEPFLLGKGPPPPAAHGAPSPRKAKQEGAPQAHHPPPRITGLPPRAHRKRVV